MTPAPAHELAAYTRLPSGCGFSTVFPDMDFETFSTAGYTYDEGARKWRSIVKSPPHGLGAVGAEVYTAHPSARILSLAYNLKDGVGERLWVPGLPPPFDLFEHLSNGGLIEAWNSAFEYHVWTNICVKKLGWPPLDFRQLRDAMAKARAFSLPGALGKAAEVTNAAIQKNKDGTRLLNKFSRGRNPTKHDPRTFIMPHEDPEDAAKLYSYNIDDIRSESAVSALIPDLSPEELELWLLDQKINFSGVRIDRASLDNCVAVVEQAFTRYEAELSALTGGTVESAGQLAKLLGWLGAHGVHMANMQAETIEETLDNWSYPDATGYNAAKRALEIRALIGSASVKKLFAIDRRTSDDGRLRDLFAFCGADRTGRFAGRGPQPQNLPNSGPAVKHCECGQYYGAHRESCPWCGCLDGKTSEWCVGAVESALSAIEKQDLAIVEDFFGDAVATVSGCLRGLFSAAPGHDLICSDYSAIEAVVLAMLAGETWREDVFRTHGKIYEMSAAKITGIPFEEFIRYKQETGDHHPMRKKIGKVAELASGFAGWLGAWKAFGADKHIGDDRQIKDAILAWRDASPNIVEFWGGQVRKHPHRWEWWHDTHGLEGAAIAAIQNPGQCYEFRGIKYGVKDDVLYCDLLSGRRLTYHQPRLTPVQCSRSQLNTLQISYMGWNTDYKKGPTGWMRLETYGGKLTENVVQATARDILTNAMKNLDAAGYDIVLHVHDEVVTEVLEGRGSIEDVERIMGIMPEWAKDWPIKAAGGWRGKRYRKD